MEGKITVSALEVAYLRELARSEMKVEAGRKIALAVDRKWYIAIAGHRFLKGVSQHEDHPTEILTGELQDFEGTEGVWLKPNEECSDFPKGSLFVPWRFIFAAVLLGPDDEARFKPGFSSSLRDMPGSGKPSN